MQTCTSRGGSNRRPGHVDLTSSDPEFCREDTTGRERFRYVGLRFPTVNVPPGATIQNAFISLEKDSRESGTPLSSVATSQFEENSHRPVMPHHLSTALTIIADCDADPGCEKQLLRHALISQSESTKIRVRPTQFHGQLLKFGAARARIETPDISTVVQDIVDSRDWKANNGLVHGVSDSMSDEGSRIALASDSMQICVQTVLLYWNWSTQCQLFDRRQVFLSHWTRNLVSTI